MNLMGISSVVFNRSVRLGGLWVAFLAVAISTPACRRDRNQVLPQENFYISVNINEPSFFDLSVPSGWVYYNGSTVDLIIYRNNLEEFTALDARSTYQPEEGCLVQVTEDNVIIEDPCSGSAWIITDGSVTSGPATLPLLKYATEFNSVTGELRIYN